MYFQIILRFFLLGKKSLGKSCGTDFLLTPLCGFFFLLGGVLFGAGACHKIFREKVRGLNPATSNVYSFLDIDHMDLEYSEAFQDKEDHEEENENADEDEAEDHDDHAGDEDGNEDEFEDDK